ncbi:hypothetical protein COCCU_12745 [Corynebacterium occultum]|uniref:DUF1707 domain-containing protein n=1 Tax=Corynebacterium occultum TaxID=2675219 RepID=A0A6B8VZM8_9CORY|nr:DUF1707 domain-containing protein [Corynebacterium occultum]QGU08449.1 hypothetical protein COCCU_12745 [Corynebacterium occultum]
MNVDPLSSYNVRLSDDERTAAMSQLGRAMSEGRLSIAEYDERCRKVAAAQTRGELDALFLDLPQKFVASQVGQELQPIYSAKELEEARHSASRPKAGILGLTIIASIGATAVAAPAISGFSALFLLFIPMMAILLYVMKIGPASWHVPSKRQLERNRLRELRTSEKIRAAELRVERKQRQHELTSQAMNVAKNFLDKKKP